MNRSLQLRTFSSSAVPAGEMVIARDFAWPGRGRLLCPAGDLIAAELRRLGGKVRRAPLAVDDRPGRGTAEVFTASYVDRVGQAVGFAIGAHRNEAELASDAVARWSRTLRSRRLVVAETSSPYHCAETACLGETSATGLPSQAQGGRMAPFPHRSRSPQCPGVAMSEADARAYAQRGDTVVLIGNAGDTMTALQAEASHHAVVVRTAIQAAALEIHHPERISFVVQPGLPVEDAMPVIAALRERFPLLRGHHFDALCHRSSDRTATASVASTGADVALVLGDPDDADSALLARACAPAHRTRVINRLDHIGPGLIESATTISLVSAHTAPQHLASALERAFSGLGPLTVISRSVSSRTRERQLTGHDAS